MKHPAIFSESIIKAILSIVNSFNINSILDPCAGTGKLALIKNMGYAGKIVCNEIEAEWTENLLYDVDEWHIGDAANMLWASSESFDAICTSPTYGNRMADHHNAKDLSKRITYTHFLGKDLNEENTGKMQWGKKYQDKHKEIYVECFRVLKPNGKMIINISDHVRKGQIINVTEWHKSILIDIGFKFINEVKVETRRMKFGSNSSLRASFESILIFEK